MINENQPITKVQLKVIENYLDKLFARLNLDVAFTKHFFERLNDERNKEQITTQELVMIYNSLYDTHGVELSHIGTEDDIDELVHSLSTDINIPIQVKYNRSTRKIDIIAKTVMRVKKFFSKSKEIQVEHMSFDEFLNNQ